MSHILGFIFFFRILQKFLLFPKLDFVVYLFDDVVANFIVPKYLDEIFDFDVI